MIKHINKKSIRRYLTDQLTGNFAGFLIGMSATGLVSQFFETRSVRNLWGITAHKKVLDKETFSNLEWVLSILIGFLVFEIMTKIVKGEISKHYPRYKFRFFRWIIQYKIVERLTTFSIHLSTKNTLFFGAVFQGLRQARSRFQS